MVGMLHEVGDMDPDPENAVEEICYKLYLSYLISLAIP